MGFIDPSQSSLAASIHPDWKVFGYLAALVLIATVASVLVPMRESFRFDLNTALKGREGAATMRSRTTSTRGAERRIIATTICAPRWSM